MLHIVMSIVVSDIVIIPGQLYYWVTVKVIIISDLLLEILCNINLVSTYDRFDSFTHIEVTTDIHIKPAVVYNSHNEIKC